MEKSQRVGLMYGYTVCLVAVITFLICISSFVNSWIDKQDPMYAWRDRQQGAPSLASYDNYRMDILKSAPKGPEGQKSVDIPDDATLHSMFEAAKADRIQSALHEANRTLVVDGLVIGLSLIIFAFHWRWTRKLAKSE